MTQLSTTKYSKNCLQALKIKYPLKLLKNIPFSKISFPLWSGETLSNLLRHCPCWRLVCLSAQKDKVWTHCLKKRPWHIATCLSQSVLKSVCKSLAEEDDLGGLEPRGTAKSHHATAHLGGLFGWRCRDFLWARAEGKGWGWGPRREIAHAYRERAKMSHLGYCWWHVLLGW